MHKAIVETRGAFQLMGSLHTGEDRVPYDRPSVVLRTYYIDSKIGAKIDGGLKLLADELPIEANDADWLETLEASRDDDGNYDVEAALAAYRSELNVAAETDEEKAAREQAEADETQRLADEAKANNKPNDTAQTAPKSGNETARADKKTHQAPAEG